MHSVYASIDFASLDRNKLLLTWRLRHGTCWNLLYVIIHCFFDVPLFPLPYWFLIESIHSRIVRHQSSFWFARIRSSGRADVNPYPNNNDNTARQSPRTGDNQIYLHIYIIISIPLILSIDTSCTWQDQNMTAVWTPFHPRVAYFRYAYQRVETRNICLIVASHQ